ncbi:uncharacterized protein LJ206_010095 [Theristicus caerulescens]
MTAFKKVRSFPLLQSFRIIEEIQIKVVLGKVLPDFCKEVESDSVKAERWQNSDFQLLLMFISCLVMPLDLISNSASSTLLRLQTNLIKIYL